VESGGPVTVADLTTFRAGMREAAVTLLSDFREDAGIRLQVYPGRPRSILPPTAFVDRIRESLVYLGPSSIQRTPQVDITVLHGLFDSKDTVDQGDRFVDAFIDWVKTRYHSAGANTLVAVVATEDDPNYVPDWLPPEEQRSYYATLITLEGFAGG
jgi:hypothetical protein